MIDMIANCDKINVIGRLGENEHRRMKFPVAEYLEMYPGAVVSLNNRLPGTDTAYPVATTTTDSEYLYWTVTSADLSREGQGQCELVIMLGTVVAKSVIYITRVLTALDGSGEAPEPWDEWQIEFARMKAEAEAAAENAETAAQAIQDMGVDGETLAPGSDVSVVKTVDPETGAVTLEFGIPRGDTGATGPQGGPGPQGQPGADGYSPIITITEITGGHRVTITDAAGPHVFDVMNGDDGQPGAPGTPGSDGYSPTVTITTITGGHRVTITDATGAHSFDVMDGQSGGGAVESVNGKTGAVVLDAGGIGYDDEETYDAGTVGAEVGNLKTELDDKLDAPATAGISGQVLTSDGQGGQSWQTPSGGDVTDVQVAGVSVVDAQGVANVPVASSGNFGVVMSASGYGTKMQSNGVLSVSPATDTQVKKGALEYNTIGPARQHAAAFYGLAKAAGADMASISSTTVGVYPEAQKSAISQMLSGSVSVSGTAPVITALPGIRYVCGEVTTLDITLPASGCIDVVFESGSTATVLTVTPPTGVTVKWAGGFDPTALDANTTYEINIADGLGVAASWT